MPDDQAQQRKTIRKLYHTLKSHLQIFEDASGNTNINAKPVLYIEKILNTAQNTLDDIVPAFDKKDFFDHRAHDGEEYYDVAGMRAYLSAALGALEVELEDENTTPITQHRTFSFVVDQALRIIIERDYVEIQKAFVAGCFKSAIILSGGAIESILLDVVKRTPAAISSAKAPKGAPDAWGLSDLIKVSVDVDALTPAVEKLSYSIREYRNLVHPGREIRERLSASKEEATIAVEVLHILHRELTC